MIHEFRVYGFAPGGAPNYLQFFSANGLPIITQYLPLVGYWMTETGSLNRLVHLWAYQSMADRAQRRAALQADALWTQGILPQGLPMIRSQMSIITEVIRLPEAVASRSQASLMQRSALSETEPKLVDRYGWWSQLPAGGHSPALSEAPCRWRVIAGEATGSSLTLSAPMTAATLTDEGHHGTLLRAATISVL